MSSVEVEALRALKEGEVGELMLSTYTWLQYLKSVSDVTGFGARIHSSAFVALCISKT